MFREGKFDAMDRITQLSGGGKPPTDVTASVGNGGSDDSNDMLVDAFWRQFEFMEMLRDRDLMPEFPVDITSKLGQRIIKETIFNMFEEAFEASYTLKNRAHRVTDDRQIDQAHYREEIVDAFSFFMEVCLLSGITPQELYEGFKKKNKFVKERLLGGY